MTTTHPTPDATATTATTLSATVDRFLAAASAGRGPDLAALYAAGAVFDATVPGWRFQQHGPARIAAQYTSWFNAAGTFEELVRLPVPGGEYVRYALRSHEDDGTPFVAHHTHLFELGEDGAIVRDTVFCGGRWNEALLARMAEEQRRA